MTLKRCLLTLPAKDFGILKPFPHFPVTISKPGVIIGHTVQLDQDVFACSRGGLLAMSIVGLPFWYFMNYLIRHLSTTTAAWGSHSDKVLMRESTVPDARELVTVPFSALLVLKIYLIRWKKGIQGTTFIAWSGNLRKGPFKYEVCIGRVEGCSP